MPSRERQRARAGGGRAHRFSRRSCRAEERSGEEEPATSTPPKICSRRARQAFLVPPSCRASSSCPRRESLDISEDVLS